MCDHSNDPGGREAAMPIVKEGVWCDPCLVPLIEALNDSGHPTVASCCGHGRRPGRISLTDGRELWLFESMDAAEILGGLWPGINDEPPTSVVVHTNGVIEPGVYEADTSADGYYLNPVEVTNG